MEEVWQMFLGTDAKISVVWYLESKVPNSNEESVKDLVLFSQMSCQGNVLIIQHNLQNVFVGCLVSCTEKRQYRNRSFYESKSSYLRKKYFRPIDSLGLSDLLWIFWERYISYFNHSCLVIFSTSLKVQMEVTCWTSKWIFEPKLESLLSKATFFLRKKSCCAETVHYKWLPNWLVPRFNWISIKF